MSPSYSVVVSRVGGLDEPIEQVVIGPFRRRERAEARAATVKRLADKYEDPEGCTGDNNALFVEVMPIRSGATSARDALGYLYGGLV